MGLKLLLLSLLGVGTVYGIRLNHQGKSKSYYYDERPNGNQCQDDYQCDGLRTCTEDGWCDGTAR